MNRTVGSGELVALGAHPLLREYFARRVREQQPEAWRAAHRRLYEHLCATTHEGDQPTLEALQPLYQAVAHGGHAGLQQKACDEVYYARITRAEEKYARVLVSASPPRRTSRNRPRLSKRPPRAAVVIVVCVGGFLWVVELAELEEAGARRRFHTEAESLRASAWVMIQPADEICGLIR